MKKVISISLIYLFLLACKDVNSVSAQNFHSYQEAIATVENASFRLHDQVDTSRSSWIKSADYYSDNLKDGYLIIETKKKKYIFSHVPINVWKEFKQADSFGSFYNKYIRGRYKLQLL